MKFTRSEQREQAFALVFEQIFNDAPVDELIENAVEARDLEVSDYARDTAKEVAAHLTEIDDEIERFTVPRLHVITSPLYGALLSS